MEPDTAGVVGFTLRGAGTYRAGIDNFLVYPLVFAGMAATLFTTGCR